jgi:hypothetical protein
MRGVLAGMGLVACLFAPSDGIGHTRLPAPAAPQLLLTVQARPAEREAVVVNELGLAVRELYLAPTGQAEPGPDRLGADTLPAGGTFRVRLGRNQPCSFSLRAVLSDETVQERHNLDLCRNTRVTLGDLSLPLRDATINNDTDLTVRELFAARPGADTRGPDRLGAEVVQPGETWRLRLGRTRDCVFDITAVMADGSEVSRPRSNLCRNPRVALADPGLTWREATIANRSGRTMQALHAMPGGRGGEGPEGGWSVDRLDDATVGDGRNFRLRLRLPGCEVDLRAVYEDNAAEEKRGVDLCRQSTVTFDGSGIPRPVERSLTLVNRHGARVDEVYVSSSTEGDWGPERLPGGLGRNDRQDLSLPVDCGVDLRIVFPNGAAEERRELDICQNPIIVLRPGWTIAARLDDGESDEDQGPRPGSVRLRNTAGVPIVELYLDPPGAPRGDDRLGATVLGVNETLDVTPPDGAGCPTRLVAVFRDGREVVRDNLDLCAGTEVPLQ